MRRSRTGFTLLEAILALAILAMVAVAVLELRARSVAQQLAVAEAQRRAHATDALVDLLINGVLGRPEREDAGGPDGPGAQPGEGAAVWRGQMHGLPYTVRRTRVALRSPLPAPPTVEDGPDAASSPAAGRADVTLWRYDIELGAQEVSLLWHR